MLAWIQTNLATLVVSLVLLLIVASILLHLIRVKKQGKSSCGCDCGSCGGCGSCHRAP